MSLRYIKTVLEEQLLSEVKAIDTQTFEGYTIDKSLQNWLKYVV